VSQDRRRHGVAAATRRAIALALAVALAAGCATLAPRPLPPRAAVEDLAVNRLTAADARFTLGLAVSNPNAYDLTVDALDVALAVEGEPFVTGALPAPATLRASAVTRVEIEVRASLIAFAAAIARHGRLSSIRYELSGSAIGPDGWRLPFRRTGELPVPDLAGPKR
jgi:LEA14-like dessication related protein